MAKLISTYEADDLGVLVKGEIKYIKQAMYRLRDLVPNENILAEKGEKNDIIYFNCKQVVDEMDALGDGLIDMGLEDCHIAICAENSVRYVIADMTISSGVGTVTPIDKDAPVELLQTLLSKADVNAVICSAYLLSKLEEAKKNCPELKVLITIDKKVDGYAYYGDIVEKGYQLQKEGKGVYVQKEIDLDAPAKILFTSGTTGANKGVVLTNRNLGANMVNCCNVVKVPAGKDVKNISMSVLPMHHATEINTHIMARIISAKLTCICKSMRDFLQDLKVFKPSVIVIVPMMANMMYNGVWAHAKKIGKDKLLKKGIKLTNLLEKFGIDIKHKLFSDVHEAFGGQVNQIVVGGAALNPTVIKGFKDLGIRVSNGYGITECGPLISMNSETHLEYRSVGKPCPGLEVKLLDQGEDGVGELCVKGPNVAKGYYKDEIATKKVFLEDGFFNTGDLATIDKKGRIFLTGRKKNVIVLENGKNIYPEEVETEIENNMSYASDVVVYPAPIEINGKEKEVLCAGLYIEDESIRNNVDKIKQDINLINQTLVAYKRVSMINLTKAPYVRTATRKIKRDTVMNLHNSENIIKL